MITNFILSLLITNTSLANDPFKDMSTYLKEDTLISDFINLESENNLKMSSLVSYLNLIQLIQCDIYDCTKPNIGRVIYHYDSDNRPIAYQVGQEGNDVANLFFKYDLWNEGFYASLLGIAAVNLIADNIDKSGTTSTIINFGIQLAELWAINSWRDFKPNKKIALKANLLVIRF